MARRYRYAIIKKKEAAKGKLSVGLAIASLLLFGGAVGIAYVLEGSYGFIGRHLPVCSAAFRIWISDGNQ